MAVVPYTECCILSVFAQVRMKCMPTWKVLFYTHSERWGRVVLAQVR